MDLIPSQDDVIRLFRHSGALRDGHFEYCSGIHTDQWLEPAIAMRSWQNAKILSVGLSRLIRSDIALRTVLPELAVVAATASGMAIACGLAEVLRPKQLYWVERDDKAGPVRFRQFLNPSPGDRVLIVDDVLRSGRSIAEAADLVEAHDAVVLGIAILIHQRDPTAINFGPIPVHALVRLEAPRYFRAHECPACRRGVPLEPRIHANVQEAAACAS